MNFTAEPTELALSSPRNSEIFPELLATAHAPLARGDALEAFRAFDDGVFAAVPHALEAYISHQRFNLN